MQNDDTVTECVLTNKVLLVLVIIPSVLLERVFLRIGSADTDEQLEVALGRFLPPVLLKLASQTDGVRKKVCPIPCCSRKQSVNNMPTRK